MSVDLLLHHGQHVERVAHRVEAQDHWQLLETSPVHTSNLLLGSTYLVARRKWNIDALVSKQVSE